MEDKENQGVVKNSFVNARKLRLIGKAILVFAAIANIAAANSGVLQIDNILNGALGADELFLVHLNGTEGPYDIGLDKLFFEGFPIGSHSLYSNCQGVKLGQDYRPIDSTTSVDIGLNYNGTISTPAENHLQVSMPYGSEYEFGNEPITIQEDNGQRNDVRKAITNAEIGPGVGKISLDDVPAGASGDYATATLHFRNVADLNNSGTVDLVDFSTLSNNWLGEGLGDISGPDGLPDGIVDIYDLLKMVDQWLDETGQ